MAEYIDKKSLIGKIKSFTSDVIFRGSHDFMLTGKDTCNPTEWTRGYKQGVLDTNSLIAQTPAADVVEVVRCKDCEYFLKTEVNGNGFLICSVTDMEIFEDDFCSQGERRSE